MYVTSAWKAIERSYVDGVAVAGGQGEAAAGERDVDDDRAERGVQGGHGEVEGDEGPEGLHAGVTAEATAGLRTK